jgi:hypothetical protein
VLTLVLDAAIDVTGAERAIIMLAQAGKPLEFTRARGRGRITLSGEPVATSRKIPDTVFATGQPMIVEDLLEAGLAAGHPGTVAMGIRHVLCTPLRLLRVVDRVEDRQADELIGVLYLDSRERGALGSPSTRSALETLSTEAAGAIENARLYREALERAKLEQELRVAASIQHRRCCPLATSEADSSRPRAPPCCAEPSGATSSITSSGRAARSGSSSATSRARGRRPPCWPPAPSACSVRKPRTTRARPRSWRGSTTACYAATSRRAL